MCREHGPEPQEQKGFMGKQGQKLGAEARALKVLVGDGHWPGCQRRLCDRGRQGSLTEAHRADQHQGRS